MGELIKRSVSGLLYVALISFSAYYSFTAVSVLMSVFLFICCNELSKLLKMSDTEGSWFALLSVVTYYLLLMPIYVPLGEFYYVPLAIASATVVIMAGMQKYDMVFGWIYLAFPLALISFLGLPDLSYENGEWTYIETFDTSLIMVFFAIMWTYDVMAYVVGRLFGKHKLAPNTSPGKTWEGAFGGLMFAILMACIISAQFDIDAWLVIPMAIIIVVFGTMGDLLESMLKRQANVKDSGTLIPGHGGLLDRLDSTLIAIPATVSFIFIYKNLM